LPGASNTSFLLLKKLKAKGCDPSQCSEGTAQSRSFGTAMENDSWPTLKFILSYVCFSPLDSAINCYSDSVATLSLTMHYQKLVPFWGWKRF
jgi:hypothetical protein